jgi:hypothetical protein
MSGDKKLYFYGQLEGVSRANNTSIEQSLLKIGMRVGEFLIIQKGTKRCFWGIAISDVGGPIKTKF